MIKIIFLFLIMFLLFVGATVNLLKSPCPTQDSTNCIWDASVQGEGRTFITVGNAVLYLN